MTIRLSFAGRSVDVAETTLELAEMAYVNHGEALARRVLRELLPELSLLEAGAAMAEARRRLDTRLRTSLDLTVRDICEELAASLKDLEQASSRADRQRAREGEACCRLALAPADQHVAAEQARQQVADRINHRRGVKP